MKRYLTIFFMSYAVCGGDGLASSARVLNLAEMTQAAEHIFSGKVLEVKRTTDEQTRLPVQIVKIEIREFVKGNAPNPLVFKQLDDSSLGDYSITDEVILFLYPKSSYGFTSAVGAGQGSFRMKLLNGLKVFANRFNNRGLLTGLSQPQSLLLEDSTLSRIPTGGPLDEDRLLQLTRQLAQSSGKGSGK